MRAKAKEVAKIAGVATLCFIMIVIGSQVGSHLQAPTSSDSLTIAEQAVMYEYYNTDWTFRATIITVIALYMVAVIIINPFEKPNGGSTQ